MRIGRLAAMVLEWIFGGGSKTPDSNTPPAEMRDATIDALSSGVGSVLDTDVTSKPGRFDPTILERIVTAAKALQELRACPKPPVHTASARRQVSSCDPFYYQFC